MAGVYEAIRDAQYRDAKNKIRFYPAGSKLDWQEGMPTPSHYFKLISGTGPEKSKPSAPKKDNQNGSEHPKALPGGFYELPDGTKVRGKEAAEACMKELLASANKAGEGNPDPDKTGEGGE